MRKSANAKPAAPIHVLLVDDNRDGLLVRKAILEEQHFTITTATNGEEGLEVYTKGKFALVVTDFKMPKMNGIELIARIRGLQPAQLVILVSGFADALGLDEKSTGADAVVNKGAYEIPHLLRAVTKLLARHTPKRPPSSQRRATARAKSV